MGWRWMIGRTGCRSSAVGLLGVAGGVVGLRLMATWTSGKTYG